MSMFEPQKKVIHIEDEDDEESTTLVPRMHINSDDIDPKYALQKGSEVLQRVVESFRLVELYGLDFSVTVADPSQADCPLVACSIGFTELTGYGVDEIVGRNCRFLLNDVPQEFINEGTRMSCRSFCASVAQGEEYDGCAEMLPPGVGKAASPGLPKGELLCVQTNARKDGCLFENMFYLKQVNLDDVEYIVGLQAGLPERPDDEAQLEILQDKCKNAWAILDSNMAAIEQVLASQFWYQAPLRRQVNF